jgi:hypothetical protein
MRRERLFIRARRVESTCEVRKLRRAKVSSPD